MNLAIELRSVSLALIAMVCTDAALCAQNYFPSPDMPKVISNRRQIATLALREVPPEYPPVAKVNYIEGAVKLQITVNDHGQVSGYPCAGRKSGPCQCGAEGRESLGVSPFVYSDRPLGFSMPW